MAPLVSIGLPVYNGERYVALALESLLAQDWRDFELIVSDNASTDRTEEICRRFATRDERIRYLRNPSNIGAVANFDHVLHLARGRYFMWAAHDDLWAPSYVSTCVRSLEATPEAVLACSDVALIDEDGRPFTSYPSCFDVGSVGHRERGRVRRLLRGAGWYAIYGLIRREALSATRLRNVWSGDVVKLFELALRGSFVQVREPLLFYRMRLKTVALMMESMDPKNARCASRCPFTDYLLELLDIAAGCDLSAWRRVCLVWEVVTTICLRNRTVANFLVQESLRAPWPTGHRAVSLVVAQAGLISLRLLCPFISAADAARDRFWNARRRGWRHALWHLPGFLLLNPTVLVSAESWRAVARRLARCGRTAAR